MAKRIPRSRTGAPPAPVDPCPHGPDEPCTCDGCWACDGYEVGCTCDIDWGELYERRMA